MQERFDCFNRGELDRMLEMYADDAEFDLSAVFTDDGPVRGHDAMRRRWKRLQETWGGGIRVDPIELLDAGNDRYVLDVRLWGKGTRSGAEVEQRFAFLYDLRADGKVHRARLYPDVSTALAEAESSLRKVS